MDQKGVWGSPSTVYCGYLCEPKWISLGGCVSPTCDYFWVSMLALLQISLGICVSPSGSEECLCEPFNRLLWVSV